MNKSKRSEKQVESRATDCPFRVIKKSGGSNEPKNRGKK